MADQQATGVRSTNMVTRAARTHASTGELLLALAAAENDLWTHGGIHRQHHRRDLLTAALNAGCTINDIAQVLDIAPTDVHAWAPASNTPHHR